MGFNRMWALWVVSFGFRVVEPDRNQAKIRESRKSHQTSHARKPPNTLQDVPFFRFRVECLGFEGFGSPYPKP